MKLDASKITEGSRLIYNDGRPGHCGAICVVEKVTPAGMSVQFEDRADSTEIRFDDREWMDHLSIEITNAQIANQYTRNADQLEGMARRADKLGRKVGGYTADELRFHAASAREKAALLTEGEK